MGDRTSLEQLVPPDLHPPACSFFLTYFSHLHEVPPEVRSYWPGAAGWVVVGLSCEVGVGSGVTLRVVDLRSGDTLIGDVPFTANEGLTRIILAIRSDSGVDKLARPSNVVFLYSITGIEVFGPTLRVPVGAAPRLFSGEIADDFAWWRANQKGEPEAWNEKAQWRAKLATWVPVTLRSGEYRPVLTCGTIESGYFSNVDFLRVDVRLEPSH
jgi:hypothetical protein